MPAVGDDPATKPSVVAIGGGHGLSVTLAALRRLPVHPVAVVAVADDGGSTGRLRSDSERVAPGDLRKCLVALAGRQDALTQVMEHRFASGELQGHAFGNLLLAALEESEGDLMAALGVVSDLLEVRGTVLPATVEVVDLVAELSDGETVVGQVAISASEAIERVHLDPEPRAPDAVVQAIRGADAVVLGPGSLYTSVLAAASVPGISEALGELDAPLVYVCNLRPQRSETAGYDVAAHVEALARHGIHPDVVLHDPAEIGGADQVANATPAPLARPDRLAHDPALLAEAFGELVRRGC